MKTSSELIGNKLEFNQPSIWKSIYELRNNGELLATMQYKKFFSETATVEFVSGGKFEIKSSNFFGTKYDITEIGKQLPTATYTGAKWKQQGELVFYTNEKLFITFSTFRKSFELFDDKNNNLIRYVKNGFWKSVIEIQVNHSNALLDKYNWLVIVPCFLSLQYDRHKAAAI